MRHNWKSLTIKQAGVFLIDCDHRTPKETPNGYPYVSIPQLQDGRITFSEAKKISKSDFLEWTRKANPQAHDVVLSRRCNPGESAYVPPDVRFALGQNLVLLRSDCTHIHPYFLRWLVKGPEWWQQVNTYLNVGAVFTSLKCADIPKFKLSIPPIEEQVRISECLAAIDDKIALNRRINQTLEAMAQAIFKSWFVDFEPVKAKIAAKQKWLSMHPSPPGRGAGGEGASIKPSLPEPILTFARHHRAHATDAEALMWKLLRNRQLGVKFRRQHPLPPYILDFYCHERRLALELDGGQHYTPDGLAADARRTQDLLQQGIRVVRFSNREVLQETEAVLERVWRETWVEPLATDSLTPTPLPEGEGLKEAMLRAAMCAISGKSDPELDALKLLPSPSGRGAGGEGSLYDQLAATAALFPDEMVESELGEIPKGWASAPLSDIADVVMGQSPDGETYNDAGVGMALINGPVEFDVHHPKCIKWTTQPTKISQSGDLIVCIRGSTTGKFVKSDGVYCLGRGVCAIRAREASWQPFLDQTYKGSLPKLLSLATGSTFPNWSGPTLKSHRILKPVADVVRVYAQFIQPALTQISSNDGQIRSLQTLRDTLLPKLLSGELTVADATAEAIA